MLKKYIIKKFELFSSFNKLINLNYKSIDIYIIVLAPRVGMGDLIMISSLIQSFAKSGYFKSVTLVSNHENIFYSNDFSQISIKEFLKRNKRNAILISPTLSLLNIIFIFKTRYFFGYFMSTKILSNISNCAFKYDPSNDNYFYRFKPFYDYFKLENKSFPTLKSHIIKIKDLEINKYLCIAPYSNWNERQYPEISYNKIINKLSASYKIVLIGGNNPSEVAMCDRLSDNKLNVLNLAGKISINQSIYLIKNSLCYIGNDSGPSHIAIIQDVFSIIIYGCVESSLRLSEESLSNPLKVKFGNASRCKYYPCYDGIRKAVCNNSENKFSCLTSVNPDLIIETFSNFVNK